MFHFQIADELAVVTFEIRHADARAHAHQEIEQRRARRIQSHAANAQMRARHQQRRHDKKRRRGKVRRHHQIARRQRGPARQRDLPPFHAQVRAELAERDFRVVARAHRFGDRRLPSANSPANSTHVFTCALGTGRV